MNFLEEMLDPLKAVINVQHIEKDFEIADLTSNEWDRASISETRGYWSGVEAPSGRHFEARLLWSDTALYVRFDAAQHEQLVVSESPDITTKTRGLWDRDVCEIFIAPDRDRPNTYFEFEVAPTGEWIDLAIELTPDERVTDLNYASGMQSTARINEDKVVMAIMIPFAGLRKTPEPGDIWLGNLFRCIGHGPTRGYLARQPTRTKEPSFHVPDAFGEIKFLA